jgi:hypothetical protein
MDRQSAAANQILEEFELIIQFISDHRIARERGMRERGKVSGCEDIDLDLG